MRRKIFVKKLGERKSKIKVRYLVVMLAVVLAACVPRVLDVANAAGCPDLRVVFARGSGGERWNDQNYLEFKSTIESKLATTGLNYEFIDLDYPAVGVGLDKLDTTLGAFFGAGEAYEFGNSVKTGAKNLIAMVNGASCPGTKYVVGGYSQGAMVVSKALSSLKADRVVYAATFGDPKIYLPEGKGAMPAACRGENLSDYRMYVPDCQAYMGLLGAYIPYEPEALTGKVGTWCNKRDIFCSSRLSISDHLGYITDDLYEDASRVIFDKICKSFGLENRISSPHDTAILVDATSSMANLMDQYREKIAALARETFAAGGRIALYYYGGVNSGYQPIEYCNFETCNMVTVKVGLERIRDFCGGNNRVPLTTVAFHTMTSLSWKYGSTKSLVVMTDANLDPSDTRGMSLSEVTRVSKRIDPVNFYIITEPEAAESYGDLAAGTDGRVATSADEIDEMMEYILARYDSLSRVEEAAEADEGDDVEGATKVVELPSLTVKAVEQSGNTVTVKFENTGTRVLVALNGAILGVVEGDFVAIGELELGEENTVTLTPLGDDVRGEAVEIELSGRGGAANVLGAPNTGRL